MRPQEIQKILMRVDYSAYLEIEKYLDSLEGEIVRLRTVLFSLSQQCANSITPQFELNSKRSSSKG